MSAKIFTISLKAAEVASSALLAMHSLRADFPELAQPIQATTELANCALENTFRHVGANGHSPTPSCGSCATPVSVSGASPELCEENPPSPSAWEPDSARDVNRCKALMLEILRRAAHDWVLYRQHSKMGNRELAEDAYAWLFEDDEGESGFTSLFNICECLDLPIETVRARVRQMNVRQIIASGRPAETRRVKRDASSVEECGLSVPIDVDGPTDSEHVSRYESYGSVATPAMLSLSDVQGVW